MWYGYLVLLSYSRVVRKGAGMAISASEARQRLFPLLEQVNTDHEPVRITSKAGDAVLMSAGDYDSWQETVYLLRSPENARRLMEAVARDKAGDPTPERYTKSINELEEMAGGRSQKYPLRSGCLGGLPVLVGLRPQDGPSDHQADCGDSARSDHRDRKTRAAQG